MSLLADRDEVISGQRAAVVDAHAARAAAEAGMDAAMRALEAFSRGMDLSADAERLLLLVRSLRPEAFAADRGPAESAARVTAAPFAGRDPRTDEHRRKP